MIKKLFLILLCAVSVNNPMSAQSDTLLVDLSVKIDDPTLTEIPIPRAPIQVPCVYLADNTLLFSAFGARWVDANGNSVS